jgi:hypothetical protein
MSEVVKVKVAVPAAYIAEGDYAELIQVYGYEFAVSFVAGEINVRGTASLAYDKRPGWQIKSCAKLAKEHVAKQIASFGEEFMNKHKALYEL